MSQQPFGDIPLFRELQRLLAAGGGPVNYEIARQVAAAIATQGSSDTDPPRELAAAYAEGMRAAEPLLAGYTRLTFVEPSATEAIGRDRWLQDTMTSWRWLLDRMASRFTEEIGKAAPEQGEGDPMQAAMGQVAPLLMGLQVGTMLGHLANEVLGRYDVPVVREDEGRPFIVWPNARAIAAEYDFDELVLARRLGLHDAARHLIVVGVPWVDRYYRSLLTEVIDAIEIDLSDVERKLIDLQSGAMEGLTEGMKLDDALPIASTERHRSALDRLRAFLALFEGYAEHAADTVVNELVPDHARVDEALRRRRATSSDGAKALASVLGVSVDRELEQAGATFCAAVVSLKGHTALNRVWEAPDNLPTFEEIKDPFAWMERALVE